VDQALQLLVDHQHFLKRSKFSYGVPEVKYLGHIVSHNGVCVDPMKIKEMKDWPHLQTLKILRGFLGLTSYYKKFVRKYGKIAIPLVNFLKKLLSVGMTL
jgi:hypothetical protein